MKPNRLRSKQIPLVIHILQFLTAFAAIVGRVTSPAFSVRFWGVRGSIACSGPRTARYGGNTSSLEVRCGERLLLFDAGTGIRYLGPSLETSQPVAADPLLTHTPF